MPYQGPKANAVCERSLGGVRRECLDFFLILSERHLYRTVKQYQAYFNHARRHRLRYDEYIPSRRSKAPISPGSVQASASSKMRSFSPAVNRRRCATGTTSESGMTVRSSPFRDITHSLSTSCYALNP